MVRKEELRIGDKVHYQPDHYGERFENGIVKRIPDFSFNGDNVWVVYHCNDEWDRYQEFTAAITRLEDLKLGWG